MKLDDLKIEQEQPTKLVEEFSNDLNDLKDLKEENDLNNKLNDKLNDNLEPKPPETLESINQIIDEVINQNLIDENESSSLNTSINATINTVIVKFKLDESPIKQELVNNIKKRTKKNKLLTSPVRKYHLFNSPSKFSPKSRNLCKSSLNKKALCNRKTKLTSTLLGEKESKDENDDELEFNYKDKFKKRLKLDDDLISKLKDVERDLKSTSKKCKTQDKSLSDQVTNVFKRDDYLNQLICYRDLDNAKEDLIQNYQLDDLKRTSSFLDDQLLDDQLNEKLDLDNLINSLIDKLDDSSDELKLDIDQNSKNSNQQSSSLTNPIICSTNFINHSIHPHHPIITSNDNKMVSNKNLSTVNSSSNNHKEDKILSNFKSSSTTKTNGHSNGHLESQLNSPFSSPVLKKAKKDANKRKKDNLVSKSKNKANSKSLFDFLEFDEHSIKKEPNDVDESISSINASINAAINSVINNYAINDNDSFDAFDKDSSYSSPLKATKSTNNNNTNTNKRKPKTFSLQTCIKNELRKKLLQKSIKLSTKKNGTTNGLTNSKKKNGTTINGKVDKSTKVKKKDCSPNGKEKKVTATKKDGPLKTTPPKKPRTPHLAKTKSKVNLKGKRKYVKKSLRKKSEKLIRNLYKFRQYLKIKKQELLNLDQDELSSSLNMLSKDYLMSCFIDSNNLEIDFDIYDPLTISGLMSTNQPFSGTSNSRSFLSNELLDNILDNLKDSNNQMISNGHHMDYEENFNGNKVIEEEEEYNTSTEEDDEEEDDVSSQSDRSYGTSSSDSELSDTSITSTNTQTSESEDSDESSDESEASEFSSEFSDDSWTSAPSSPI